MFMITKCWGEETCGVYEDGLGQMSYENQVLRTPLDDSICTFAVQAFLGLTMFI